MRAMDAFASPIQLNLGKILSLMAFAEADDSQHEQPGGSWHVLAK
jgi:hypothetical protein